MSKCLNLTVVFLLLLASCSLGANPSRDVRIPDRVESSPSSSRIEIRCTGSFDIEYHGTKLRAVTQLEGVEIYRINVKEFLDLKNPVNVKNVARRASETYKSDENGICYVFIPHDEETYALCFKYKDKFDSIIAKTFTWGDYPLASIRIPLEYK